MSIDGNDSGMPSWVDLTSPDPVATVRFYSELFGWDPWSLGPADITGGYVVFRFHGRDVAGVSRSRADQASSWTIYFGVRDADETERAVIANGGSTLVPPTERADNRRMALLSDPEGAVFGVWEADPHPDDDATGSLGTMCWQQLMSRDVAGASAFYGAVFDWIATPHVSVTPYGSSMYAVLSQSGRDVAGMVQIDPSWSASLPAHWMVYFAVEDCDAAAAHAVELGGELSIEPDKLLDLGRTAVLGDPHGAVFSVMVPDLRLIRRAIVH